MDDKKYWLIVRTGEAEIRAVKNSSKDILSKVIPIIEITRGRKITKDKVVSYPFQKRFDKLKNAFAGQTVVIDVTSDDALSSDETDLLYSPEEGYCKWLEFLLKIKEEQIFSEIIPSILINFNDDKFEENLRKQIDSLQRHFNSVLYRCDITDENCYDDLVILRNVLEGAKLNLLIDCGYTPQASYHNFSDKCIARISNLKSLLSDICVKYIVAATSFPNNVRDLSDSDSDVFSISEIDIHELVMARHGDVVYADYASINPIRNDTINMSRGWIPRIDVPLHRLIFYYKQRRPKGVTAYAETYTNVAKRVCLDERFPYELKNNWGVSQIISCSKGAAPSSSPSFWISVRMNIHIEQQVRRLYSMRSGEDSIFKSST